MGTINSGGIIPGGAGGGGAAVTWSSGVLSTNVTIPDTATFTDVMDTDSLPTGDWLLCATACIKGPGSSATLFQVVEGTGVGTFAGPPRTEANIDTGGGTNVFQLSVTTHLNVTVEGTFTLQALFDSSGPATVLAKDDEASPAAYVTGYTAVKL